ncbi:hypothetical protein AWI37_18840 [Klebsiella aerogenes]|nr:hypothetical protein AWI37_18840 [Klebsiella aerogenes]
MSPARDSSPEGEEKMSMAITATNSTLARVFTTSLVAFRAGSHVRPVSMVVATMLPLTFAAHHKAVVSAKDTG